jgi:hypothetical protein
LFFLFMCPPTYRKIFLNHNINKAGKSNQPPCAGSITVKH